MILKFTDLNGQRLKKVQESCSMQNLTCACMASFFYIDTHHKQEIIFFFGAEFLSKFLHIPPEEHAKFTACLQKESDYLVNCQ